MNQNKTEQTVSINPKTLEVIGYTPLNTIDDLLKAVDRAKAAQPAWAMLSFDERAWYLFCIRDYIVKHADKIAETISKNCGKTRFDALSTEILNSAMAVNYYAKNGKKILKRKKLSPGSLLTINKRSYVDRVPYGIIGIISPWNYPFAIPFHEIAMALIAGNAVIYKAASQSLEVGKAIHDCVNAAKLPEGIFTMLNIPGSLAGDAFIESGVDKLFFTGSVPVGKKLMKKASEKLFPISLELGGNDAMIVCRDANINRAVEGALWAGLSNCGQSCAGVERIYVEGPIYEKFTSRLKEKVKLLRVGRDEKYDVDIGVLTTESQLTTVKQHIEDAIEKGAAIFSHGEFLSSIKGYYHPIVIVENPKDDMKVVQEETFGPVLVIEKVNSVEEAIRKTNESNLGLTASVWTKNKKLAHQTASRLEVGSVSINDHLMAHGLAETPWGGFKESGYGRTHGYLGLEAMTQPRVVIDDILPFVQRDMWWYPHNKKVYDGLKGALNFLYSKNIRLKFFGFVKLLKILNRVFSKKL